MTDQPSDIGSAQALELFSNVSSVRARAPGTFDAELSSEWVLFGKPNGGYLVALLGRAASSLTDPAHVVAASASFLRSPDPGPVEIEAGLLRRGRTISQVRARLSQGGRLCVEALVTTSELGAAAAPLWDAGVPDIEHIPFDQCIRLPSVHPAGFRIPVLDHVDMRVDPGWTELKDGRPSGRGQFRGWLELPGGESFDPASLLYAVDSFPPPTFDIDLSWVSTVALTAYVRAIPAPGPVRIVSRARLVDPPWIDSTCDVWDGTGRLVAQATQLARSLLR